MDIRELIQELAKTDAEVYSVIGKVTALNQTDRTCTVEPLNGDAELFDVRLQAVEKGANGFCIEPKINSDVVVTFINKNLAYVALCSEVENVKLNIGTQEVLIDNQSMTINGFLKVASEVSDLKTVVGELIDAIMGLPILVSGAAGTVNPSYFPQLIAIKTKFNSFLK